MSEIYFSNRGRGPGVAEIIERTDRKVCIVWRPHIKSRRRNYVELSRKFFESKACGWKQRAA